MIEDGERVFLYVPPGVPAARLRDAESTVIAWRDRVSRLPLPSPREKVLKALDAGERPAEIASGVNRRLLDFAKRSVAEPERGELWLQAGAFELQDLGYSDARAWEFMRKGADAVQRGERYFSRNRPVNYQRIRAIRRDTGRRR